MKLLTATLFAFTALSTAALAETPAEREMHSYDYVQKMHEAHEMAPAEHYQRMPAESYHHDMHHGRHHHGDKPHHGEKHAGKHHHHHHGKKAKKAAKATPAPAAAPAAQ